MVRQWEFPFKEPNWWKVLEHHTELPPVGDEALIVACYCACGRGFEFYARYNDHLLEIAREEIKTLKQTLREERSV
jgi:hypothetical protein